MHPILWIRGIADAITEPSFQNESQVKLKLGKGNRQVLFKVQIIKELKKKKKWLQWHTKKCLPVTWLGLLYKLSATKIFFL